MTTYLNPSEPWWDYSDISTESLFVDKSYIIPELTRHINARTRFLCVTRPRRFGKTVNANMIASFFGRTYDQKKLFSSLAVGADSTAMTHCGKYELLYLNMSKVAENVTDGEVYLAKLKADLFQDFQTAYPDLIFDQKRGFGIALNQVHKTFGVKFVVVMDEWDYLFHKDWATEESRKAYISFLGSFLKDVRAVALAYLTGIMPICIFSSTSDTNMFSQHATPSDPFLSKGFGFTDAEVDVLYQRYRSSHSDHSVTRESLREWYDGYVCFDGTRLYNSQSVFFALSFSHIKDYWNDSGAADEVYTAVKQNVDAVRESVGLLTSHYKVPMTLHLKEVPHGNLPSKDDVLTRMVLLGFLSYENGEVRIPNTELMTQFEEMLKTKPAFDYIYRLAEASQRILEATLSLNSEIVEKELEYTHNTESPLLQYNKESDLSLVVTLCYLSARSTYHVDRELKGGTGFVDYIFRPKFDYSETGFILELKVDATPEDAIQQIKDRNYILAFAGKLGERPTYTGRILGVGIAYDRKTKVHKCKIEVLREAL